MSPGDRANDVYARLLKERIIFLGSPCEAEGAPGGVAEWSNAAVLKIADPAHRVRGFESHPLR